MNRLLFARRWSGRLQERASILPMSPFWINHMLWWTNAWLRVEICQKNREIDQKDREIERLRCATDQRGQGVGEGETG